MKNDKPKYSEMLIELVDTFDNQLPKKWTYEDTFEMGIGAWNLANEKPLLGEKEYEKIIKETKFGAILHEMVEYKLTNFSNFKNVILKFTLKNDKLRVEHRSPAAMFEDFLKVAVNTPNIAQKK